MKALKIKDSQISFERSVRITLILTLISVLLSYATAQYSARNIKVNAQDNQIVVTDNQTTNGGEKTGEITKELVQEVNNGVSGRTKSGTSKQTDRPLERKREVKSVGINAKIDSFVASYNGSRIDKKYLKVLRDTCNNEEVLKRVIAMSVSETGMGRDTNNHSNLWGWFKGGDRSYDPSRQQMAKDICIGVKKYYYNMTPENISRYTGNDRSGNWSRIYWWAMSKM